MLEHIPDAMKCMAECKRVLRDDGLMLHSMPGRCWKVFSYFLSFARLQVPKPHGISEGHLKEWYEFGTHVWCRKFADSGLHVEQVVRMPFYVGHGNRFAPITRFGNQLDWSASFLYVVKKP